MQQNFLDTVKRFNSSNQHALVIGDVMLDRYLIGSVGRISPEAPVPIVLLNAQSERAGGAANVAANLALLGINTRIIGCIGADSEAIVLVELLQKIGIDTTGIYTSQYRPTIAKTRVLSGHQQMLRLDQESSTLFNDAETGQLLASIQTELILKPGVVILSDYAKGLLSDEICQHIIQHCQAQNITVLVDPKGRDYSKYSGATALTPNKKETAEACDTSINDADLVHKASKLKASLNLKFLAVTRGEEGITLLDDNTHHLPAIAKQVFDVSGAGDTVIATLAAGLMNGLLPLESLRLANIAAAVVVGKVGTVPITQFDLLEALVIQKNNVQMHKICNSVELLEKIKFWRQENQTITFVNGCFDPLNAKYVSYLEIEKKRCNKLIIGLNTSRPSNDSKGLTHLTENQNDFARVLAALESVDAIVFIQEDTSASLIASIKPDVVASDVDGAMVSNI
jgi:D-beta-D-heptose 7-phosphate kinase / D-beta-D-heptose 1-phosphate adenosyltransferase